MNRGKTNCACRRIAWLQRGRSHNDGERSGFAGNKGVQLALSGGPASGACHLPFRAGVCGSALELKEGENIQCRNRAVVAHRDHKTHGLSADNVARLGEHLYGQIGRRSVRFVVVLRIVRAGVVGVTVGMAAGVCAVGKRVFGVVIVLAVAALLRSSGRLSRRSAGAGTAG